MMSRIVLERMNEMRFVSNVFCDKKVILRLKGKFYRVAVRPTLLYEHLRSEDESSINEDDEIDMSTY